MIYKFYTLGFYFSYNFSQVALIRKLKPEWQKGKLNGVGGHCEPTEGFNICMQREFLEETGLPTMLEGWQPIIEHYGCDYTMNVFKYRRMLMENTTFKKAPEQVEWYNVRDILLMPDVIYNVKWMLLLALDDDVKFPIKVHS